MVKENSFKVHCNACGHETRHSSKGQHRVSGQDLIEDYGPVEYENRYEILECLGCESVVFRRVSWFEPTDQETVTLYPPPISRPAPRWKDKLPTDLGELLDEIYKALQADSPRLALMGARTAVDMVILQKVGDAGTFQQKLEAIEQQGFVGRKNREFLSAALEAGNAAVHRGHVADPEEVNHVMDIVENLLEAVYVLEGAAESLRKRTPPRPKRPSR